MAVPKKVRDAVFRRDGNKCRHCRERNGLDPHHIIYASHQGPDETWNLITLCTWNCHRAIHEGNLVIVRPADANKEVKFERKNGWRPK